MSGEVGGADLLERVRQLVEERILPLEGRFLEKGFREVRTDLEEVRREVRRRGLWAPQLPAEIGGMGLTLRAFAPIAEELGRTPLGHFCFNCQAPDAGNLELLLEFGSAGQRERFLGPLACGEVRSCFAMTEPELAGSNPVWLAATAREEAGEWVLDGHKWFASSADGAAFAVVMAVTDPEAPRHQRASLFLVPTDTPGYRLVRNLPTMGEPGEGWASHGEVELTGCRVPGGNLLGGRGRGFALAQARLGPGRIHHCMRWLGVAGRAFDLLCRRAAGRELAPGRALGEMEAVQFWIAESRAEIHAARLMVLDAAEKLDREGARAAREEVSLIKFFVAKVMNDVVDRALQVHGGLGMTDFTPLAHFYRHERAARIYDGADEVHKAFVARKILEGYGLSRR